MQRVAGWKFAALAIGMYGALLLAREVAVSIWPTAASMAQAQDPAAEPAAEPAEKTGHRMPPDA